MSHATAESSSVETGTVYEIGFDIERLVPCPENHIEKIACVGRIEKKDFLVSILEQTDGSNYNPLDIRAKIVFNGDDTYFMNRQGIVRHGSNYYLADKDRFLMGLTITACPNKKGILTPVIDKRRGVKKERDTRVWRQV